MSNHIGAGTNTNGWLGFELSVLRRLKFRSVALPFAGEPNLGLYLKNWRVRVAANDHAEWAWTKATALIENNSETLSESDVELVLDDAYAPRTEMWNPTLLNWFNETDAWWFDNVRENAELMSSPIKRASALLLGMMVGDYVLSFDAGTMTLRQPLSLSIVFRRLQQSAPLPIDNSLRNQSMNQEAREFLAERHHTDLLFLRLPAAHAHGDANSRRLVWREEWLRRGNDFWPEMERKRAGKLGGHVETRQQYLNLLEDLLHTAAHIPIWAIENVADGFISNEELAEAVTRVRNVDAIYSKDFSELTGARASIITASS
ncbi:MAG: hypothetical protein ABJC05_01085 [Pyrinomonadaceae bacterium]